MNIPLHQSIILNSSKNKLFTYNDDRVMNKETKEKEIDLTSLKSRPNITDSPKNTSPDFFRRKTNILPLVKKFVDKLKAAIFFSRITSLTEHGRKIINDLSDIPDRKIQIPLWMKNPFFQKIYCKFIIFLGDACINALS